MRILHVLPVPDSAADSQSAAQSLASNLIDLAYAAACAILGWEAGTGALILLSHLPGDRVDNGLAQALSAWLRPEMMMGIPRLLTLDAEDSSVHNLLSCCHASQILVVPLMADGHPEGMALLFDPEDKHLSTQEGRQILQILAEHTGHRLKRVRMCDTTAVRGKALYQAGLQLNASLNYEQVLEAALELALNFSPAALNGRIYLWENDKLVFGAVRWAGRAHSHPGVEPPPDGATYQAVHALKPVFKTRNGHGDALLALPMQTGEGVMGVLTLYYGRSAQPDAESVAWVQLLANQAAVAIQNARQYERVSHQAYTDVLTGLPNRRAFDDRLESETRRASRYQHPFTLIIMDLDGFKAVNDLHGHPAGDQVLKEVAACLRLSLRDTDFFARYGGDEYVVIMPETDRETAISMANRLMEAVDACSVNQPGGVSGRISLSLGLAAFPEDGMTALGLLSAADRALYEMKACSPRRSGRLAG